MDSTGSKEIPIPEEIREFSEKYAHSISEDSSQIMTAEMGAIAMYRHLQEEKPKGMGGWNEVRDGNMPELGERVLWCNSRIEGLYFIETHSEHPSMDRLKRTHWKRIIGPGEFELKQFGPEDTQELIKSVREVLDEVIYASTTRDGKIDIFDKKEASERIGFAHAAMLDAVYEGAAQWESDCKDAQSQASALRSENERLKEERDHYRYYLKTIMEHQETMTSLSKGLEISYTGELAKRALNKYPNPTT